MILVVLVASMVAGCIYYLFKKRIICIHDWRIVESETYWESSVIVKTYVCRKCGKIKRKYVTV